jgi:hypothetical protein
VESNGISSNPENPIPNNRPASQADHGISSQTCPTCGGDTGSAQQLPPPSYIYAVGRIEPRFPRLSVEKELAQVIARDDTTGLTDRKVLQSILAKPENRYLVRQMCWVFSIGGLETYILIPSDPHDVSLLIDALRPNSSAEHIDVVIGRKGPFAPADMCNGLMIPLVAFDQIYSFNRETLIHSIPKSEETSGDFTGSASDLLDRILLMTDNAGSTDEHRALNYLAMRYHGIYERAAKALAHNASLSAIETRPSLITGTRKILDVIFSYRNRNNDVTDKYFVRVDVTDEFPFLVSKMTPYYDR